MTGSRRRSGGGKRLAASIRACMAPVETKWFMVRSELDGDV
jgi:hypothetical protein